MAVATTHLGTTAGPATPRRLAGAIGATLLVAVLAMDPGRARLVLAVGAVIFLARAAGLICRTAPQPDTTIGVTDGLVELECALLEHRAWTMEQAEDIAARVERITDMVTELRDQVR